MHLSSPICATYLNKSYSSWFDHANNTSSSLCSLLHLHVSLSLLGLTILFVVVLVLRSNPARYVLTIFQWIIQWHTRSNIFAPHTANCYSRTLLRFDKTFNKKVDEGVFSQRLYHYKFAWRDASRLQSLTRFYLLSTGSHKRPFPSLYALEISNYMWMWIEGGLIVGSRKSLMRLHDSSGTIIRACSCGYK